MGGEGERLSDESLGLTGAPPTRGQPSANLPKVDLPKVADLTARLPSTYAPLTEVGERRAPHILAIHAARTARLCSNTPRRYARLLEKQAETFEAAAKELRAEAIKVLLELDARAKKVGV
jgi:hypothetical protein